MLPKRYDFFETTGDVGILVYGRSLNELFQNGGLGLFDIITDVKEIIEIEKDVELKCDSLERLFINWLNELIFLFDAEGFVARKINVNVSQKNEIFSLDAKLMGYYFDEERDEKKLLIKAATYHGFYLKENAEGFETKVLFDI